MSRHIPRTIESPVRPDGGRPVGKEKRRGPIERTREPRMVVGYKR